MVLLCYRQALPGWNGRCHQPSRLHTEDPRTLQIRRCECRADRHPQHCCWNWRRQQRNRRERFSNPPNQYWFELCHKHQHWSARCCHVDQFQRRVHTGGFVGICSRCRCCCCRVHFLRNLLFLGWADIFILFFSCGLLLHSAWKVVVAFSLYHFQKRFRGAWKLAGSLK